MLSKGTIAAMTTEIDTCDDVRDSGLAKVLQELYILRELADHALYAFRDKTAHIAIQDGPKEERADTIKPAMPLISSAFGDCLAIQKDIKDILEQIEHVTETLDI